MILCAGESLIDLVPEQDLFRPFAGGAVYNTAIALGRLGRATGYFWPISRDAFGQMLLRPLAKAGVDTSLCPRSDLPTTLAVVTLNGSEARYSFYDDGTAGRMLRIEDIPALPASVTAIFAGGISLVGDPCGAAMEALLHRHHRQLPVMLDPNIRPAYIRDPDAHRARLARLMAISDIVKLSSDDLEWLCPGLADDAAMAWLLQQGPRIVLRTDGERGASAHWQGGRIHVPAVPVTVADTIGAGDTFNAGVLTCLDRLNLLTKSALAGISAAALRDVLTLGTRAAAITVSRPGPNPPWAHEMGD